MSQPSLFELAATGTPAHAVAVSDVEEHQAADDPAGHLFATPTPARAVPTPTVWQVYADGDDVEPEPTDWRPCADCGRDFSPSEPRSYGTHSSQDLAAPDTDELQALLCWNCSAKARNRWDPFPVGMTNADENPYTPTGDNDAWNRYRHAHDRKSYPWDESGGIPWCPPTVHKDPVDALAARLAPIMRHGLAAAAGTRQADHDRWARSWIGGNTCTCSLCVEQAEADEDEPGGTLPPYIADCGYAWGEHHTRARELAAQILTAADLGQLFEAAPLKSDPYDVEPF